VATTLIDPARKRWPPFRKGGKAANKNKRPRGMTQFIDELLSDFDAEFGLSPRVGPTASFSQHEPPGAAARIPPPGASQDSPASSRQSPSAPPPDRNALPRAGRLSAEHASQVIGDLKRQRVRDADAMQRLQTENARLVAKLTILEHTDLKVAELGARVEQLLQKYLEAEQIRQQQAAQITELRQEVIVLKSRLGSHEPTPPGAAGGR
jgi:hypothetical protein